MDSFARYEVFRQAWSGHGLEFEIRIPKPETSTKNESPESEAGPGAAPVF
jgi:hypothetical protein